MNHLKLNETRYTARVDFNPDTGILEMEGASYPENPSDFFQPIFDWVNLYLKEIRNNITLNLRLNYLNTSSTKCILAIIDTLEEYCHQGGSVEVNWYYAEDDEDILESGEELAEDSMVPINLIPYSEK